MNKEKGLPIHLDQVKRQIASPTSEKIEVTDWHPSDKATENLWRCHEALRDVANLLQGTAILNNEDEKRRRVKALVTPLYSLCLAIRDLFNYLKSAPEFRTQLAKQKQEITQWQDQFLSAVPLDKNSAIRGVRDQLSAHMDKLMPLEATEIFMRAQNHEVGGWLHQCIITLSNLLLLNAYSWTTDDCPEGYVRFMTVEPWLLTFKVEDGKASEIVGMDVVDSPRKLIASTIREVVETSQWMFRSSDPRIILSKPKDDITTSINSDMSEQA